VRIGRSEFEQLLDDFVTSMDQPTIDGLNTYLVSRAAAMQGLKVALSGVGGDELFGGYPSFRQIPKIVRWGGRVPAAKRLGQVVRAIFRVMPLSAAVPPKAAGLLFYSNDIASAYLLRRSLYLEDELDALLDETWLKQGLERLSTVRSITETLATLFAENATTHAKIAALESCWYMRNQLLRDTDWSSMAHGLEVRVPFVDATLLERVAPAIASAAPPSKKDLAACAERLPPAMLNRAKTGFTTPIQQWLADGSGVSARGLRGWAGNVHRLFRTIPRTAPMSSLAAA
jgi:asparagine synthase (glutamine-hydrolysing)